jgi:hypothetical protein
MRNIDRYQLVNRPLSKGRERYVVQEKEESGKITRNYSSHTVRHNIGLDTRYRQARGILSGFKRLDPRFYVGQNSWPVVLQPKRIGPDVTRLPQSDHGHVRVC